MKILRCAWLMCSYFTFSSCGQFAYWIFFAHVLTVFPSDVRIWNGGEQIQKQNRPGLSRGRGIALSGIPTNAAVRRINCDLFSTVCLWEKAEAGNESVLLCWHAYAEGTRPVRVILSVWGWRPGVLISKWSEKLIQKIEALHWNLKCNLILGIVT